MKKIISVLSIPFFLFPSLVVGLHIFSHSEEEHCAEHETTHLHEKHQDCKVCDFSFDTEVDFFGYNENRTTTAFYDIPSGKFSFVHQSLFLSESLRAPPATC